MPTSPRCASRAAAACASRWRRPGFASIGTASRQSLTDRTRLIIVNSPQNPSCTVAERADLDALAALVRDRPISILVRRGVRERAVRRPASRLGAGAPGIARAQLRGVFIRQDAACHRLAHGLLRRAAGAHARNCARCISSTPSASPRRCSTRSPATWREFPDAWTGLSAFFEAKRDLLAGLLRGSGFEPLPAAGTYFLLVDYGALSRASDLEFADRLMREAKIATIPLSPFYARRSAHDAAAPVHRQAR